MSAANHRTDHLLRRYLSGAITAPEEAELERRARKDPALAEAMEGLRMFPEEDHALRVQRMLAGAGQQQAPPTGARVRKINWQRWSIAAGLLLLLGVAAFWLPTAFDAAGDSMAMESAPAPDAPATTVPEPALLDEAAPEEPAPIPQTRDLQSPAPTSEAVGSVNRPDPEDDLMEESLAADRTEPAVVPPVVASTPPPPPPPPAPVEELATEEEYAEAEPPAVEDALPGVTPSAEATATDREKMEPTAMRRRQSAPEAAGNAPEAEYLRGRVTTVNGAPIQNALVRIPGLPLGERSDSNGSFQIQIDQTISRLMISHPDYEDEDLEVPEAGQDLQVSMSPEERESGHDWAQDAAATKIEIDKSPGYARPEEGYGDLRKRIEANRPEGLPSGKVKVSFLVNLDGSLTDFRFRGRPDSATMEYVGRTLVETSSWNVVKGEKPVRVHFKLRFE
ncbi:hypothetical protein [Lewinella sp. W8]|uniref:hypothetical protein n=1 Tax=Lewinella sp. W8 TaxID=2528208 RepID=UPI001067C97D|nr:hypothetical protein [Lewinella sp. W8]MTB51638.1 hypothetical protein [Lewinella sp. W8]